ncbi:EamA family transporter [Marinomonas transparens]|uniref:EamA family transporter n=1 Tax=Marinomonas transparens TaxID=2795388 RepID=A0A934JI64_9GAMM|nr:EamA family transporter [Marinomonas transparens]MBJ7536236.1 EamA family transporter [Marinomonas transparens]
MSFKDSMLALVIIVAWGLNFVVISVGVSDVPPLLLGGLRFLAVAAIGSLLVKRPNVPLRWWFSYALPIGFLQFAFLFVAMANGMPAGLASLVLQSQALFTMLFALVFLKEGVRLHQVLAIVLAGGGLVMIAVVSGVGDMTLVGFILTLFAAASWAVGNIGIKRLSQKGYQMDIKLVIWSAWIPPLPFFIASWFMEGPELMLAALTNISWSSIGALAYLALIATILGYSLWGYLMGRYFANQVAPLTLGVPVVGLTAAAVILDETLLPLQWIGVCFVLLGLLMNTFGARLFYRIPMKVKEV